MKNGNLDTIASEIAEIAIKKTRNGGDVQHWVCKTIATLGWLKDPRMRCEVHKKALAFIRLIRRREK